MPPDRQTSLFTLCICELFWRERQRVNESNSSVHPCMLKIYSGNAFHKNSYAGVNQISDVGGW